VVALVGVLQALDGMMLIVLRVWNCAQPSFDSLKAGVLGLPESVKVEDTSPA